MNLDQVGKVEAAPHILVVCRQHLCEDYVWSISDQDDEIVNCCVWKKQTSSSKGNDHSPENKHF